ncbi:MAG: hypothetical protein KA297_23125 [Kofleriaceae bacterium]|jgi:hypothetical protein|nr:hypothetical protein [Kofleriaceae bacterium]MBP6839217.1 hypothetical protein [Kofleriaceae bacterium]
MSSLTSVSVGVLAAAAALVIASADAGAVPRFAARNGNECIQCHVSPAGGGIRNAYGRNVFERVWLPRGRKPAGDAWVVRPPATDGSAPADGSAAAEEDDDVVFDPEINEWMVLGGDLRAAYIFIRPDEGATPEAEPDVTSSFFLMQADLYHAMTLNRHVTAVLDVGAYSGFEAWGLYHLNVEPATYDLMVRVGKFMPAFGIREVEHQLFTRERIGLGATDRDTGVEVTAFAGPVTAAVAVLNGTLGDTAFDTHGTSRKAFEKAVAARLSARADLGWIRGQLGASFYFNQGSNQASPLLAGAIPSAMAGAVGQGVNEVRAGGFLTLNLGRFTYLADLAWVRDNFYSDQLPTLRGYASYQELSMLPTQGVDVVGTLEFADPDMDLLDNRTLRAGLAVEFFPWPFTELRAMVRRTWDEGSASGDAWDLVVFSHLFM